MASKRYSRCTRCGSKFDRWLACSHIYCLDCQPQNRNKNLWDHLKDDWQNYLTYTEEERARDVLLDEVPTPDLGPGSRVQISGVI